MFRDAAHALDESDRAVSAILIGENVLAWCERAAETIRDPAASRAQWRLVRDTYDEFPELWRFLDRARRLLARRGANTLAYDELRPNVRTRLATADDDGTHVNDEALDDARRAVAELKLAVPGADWQGIEQRTRGLVAGPFFRQRRNRLAIGSAIGAIAVIAFACLAIMIPPYRHERESMRHQLTVVAEQRRARILDLQRELVDACTPSSAQELTRLLVMDNRRADAKAFAAAYTVRCGENLVVMRWAAAPRPGH